MSATISESSFVSLTVGFTVSPPRFAFVNVTSAGRSFRRIPARCSSSARTSTWVSNTSIINRRRSQARAQPARLDRARLLFVLEPRQFRRQPPVVMLGRLIVRRLLDLVLDRLDLFLDGHAMRNRAGRTTKNLSTPALRRLPHGANAFGLQALDRVQDQPPGAGRVRRQVEAAEHAVDEQAGFVEHLLEFREGVRADRRGELPRPFPIDDYLAGLEPPPEQVERRVLEDDGPVVPRLPALRRQPRHEAVAVEQLHEELPPRPSATGDARQGLTGL